MRIVSALILITLVAAVFVARSAPSGDDKSPTPSPQDGPAVAAMDASQARGAGDAADQELPSSFPAELTSRSHPGGAAPAGEESAPMEPKPFTDMTEGGDVPRSDLTPSFDLEGPAKPSGELEPSFTIDLETPPEDAGDLAIEPATTSGDLDLGKLDIDRPGKLTIERPASADRGPALREPSLREPSLREPTLRDSGAAADVPAGAGGTERVEIALPGSEPAAPAGRTTGDIVLPGATAPSGSSADAQPPVTLSNGSGNSTVGRVNGPVTPVGGWTARGRVVRSSGAALSNVRVQVRDRATDAPLGQTLTGLTGEFEIGGLQVDEVALWVDAGTLPLGVAAQAGTNRCRTGSEPVGYGAVCARASGGAVEIELPNAAGVEGTIVNGGQIVSGALVRAVSRVSGYESVRVLASSDDSGSFALALVPGPYELQILVPGQGGEPDRARRVNVEAEAGSALLLDTVDVRKGTRIADAGSPPVERGAGEVTLAPAPAAVDAPAARSEGGVLVTGRVISTWGEAIDKIEVVAMGRDGEVIRRDWTDSTGRYELNSLPFGEVRLEVAPGQAIGRPSEDGITLRKRPSPFAARSFPGQERVVLQDVVIDVAPIFRVQGRVRVAKKAFEAFKASLDEEVQTLSDARLLRAYLRGLRLVQTNRGGKGKPRQIDVGPDGRFTWTCTLPAEDVLFQLEPRSSSPGPGYAGPVGVAVTPAGVRTAKLDIAYPPTAKSKKAKKRK